MQVDDLAKCFMGFTCWFIWKEICCFVFKHVQIDLVAVSLKINHEVMEFWGTKKGSAMLNVSMTTFGRPSEVWSTPSRGVLEFNSDGTYVGSTCRGGIEEVVSDAGGILINGLSGSCCVASAFMAEAEALRKAVSMAVCMGCKDVIFEYDCLELVSAMKNKVTKVHWVCYAILEDIVCMLGANSSFQVSSIERKANLAAD